MAAGTPVWSSRFAFIMASVGFAVGLGNIWRFPYVTGENGGGAFVLVYLLFVLAIGVPCVMAELMVGRRGQSSPSQSMATVAEESGRSRSWGGGRRARCFYRLYHLDYLRSRCWMGALVFDSSRYDRLCWLRCGGSDEFV